MIDLDAHRLVPLATPTDAAEADALGGLADGGIRVVEIALRTPYALEAIRRTAAAGELTVGAGTVLDVEHARAAIDAGASFLVSPGLDRDVVELALASDVAVLPGIMTPTEAMAGRALGLSRLKVFPASVAGGLALVDALASVLPDIRFMPSGGVSHATLQAHLAHPAVFAVSGSWLASSSLLARGADAVAVVAHEAVTTAQATP